MSRLLRLYPAAWRERYEVEFREVLAEQRLGLRASLDVIGGAIDARLNPELVGAERQPWTHHLPGLLATIAGLIWSWFWIHAYLTPEEWGDSMGIAVVLMMIAVPGDYMAAYGRRIGIILAIIGAGMVLGRALPWSVGDGLLNIAAGATAWLLVAAGTLTLVAVRAGIGPAGRWVLLATVVLVPAMIAIPILGGFGPGDPGGATAMLVALLPYGIAWVLLGLRMMLRGSATIRGTTPNPAVTEVPAT